MGFHATILCEKIQIKNLIVQGQYGNTVKQKKLTVSDTVKVKIPALQQYNTVLFSYKM
jgi:hypothetical protein